MLMTFIFGKYFNVAINFIKNWLFFILIQFLLKILINFNFKISLEYKSAKVQRKYKSGVIRSYDSNYTEFVLLRI